MSNGSLTSITVEIVSKTTSEAGTTFVLAASEEEIKRAGFVPYFADPYFHGYSHDEQTEYNEPEAVTPYGSVVLDKQAVKCFVYVLPFVPALTEVDVNSVWINKNAWLPYKLVKTPQKPNGTYELNSITPNMNVGDTLVFYNTKPADPA